MDNRWYKIKNNIKSNSNSLRSIGVGFLLFVVLYILTKIFNCSLCPIKNLFGISCPGCGLTRAFICILKLDVVSAINYNILSIPLFLGICIYIIMLMFDVLLNTNIIRKTERFLLKKYMYPIYVIILFLSMYINTLLHSNVCY